MEAYDVQAVVDRLHRESYFPLRVESAEAPGRFRLGARVLGGSGRIPPRELQAFTRELATLLEAGLPLERGLAILVEVAQNLRLRSIVQDVGQSVRTGSTLADAMARHQPRPFSRLYVNTVRAGEKGGVLEVALRRLAEHLEATRELREAVVSALIYPALLATVGVGAVVFLLTFVLPRFAVIFADLGQGLPWPTQALLTVSHAVVTYWWVGLLAVALLLIAWQLASRSEAARLRVDRWLLGVPLIGDLLRKIAIGRATRTLGTLLGSGVPLLSALGVTREVAGNRVAVAALQAVQEGVKRGDGFARPMAESGAFPPLAVHLVRVGEETGRLEEMLGRIATTYEAEVRVAVRRVVAVLEPAIILVLGLVVLGIVLAILMAILSINELPL